MFCILRPILSSGLDILFHGCFPVVSDRFPKVFLRQVLWTLGFCLSFSRRQGLLLFLLSIPFQCFYFLHSSCFASASHFVYSSRSAYVNIAPWCSSLTYWPFWLSCLSCHWLSDSLVFCKAICWPFHCHSSLFHFLLFPLFSTFSAAGSTAGISFSWSISFKTVSYYEEFILGFIQ